MNVGDGQNNPARIGKASFVLFGSNNHLSQGGWFFVCGEKYEPII